MREQLKTELGEYIPFNEQEKRDREVILEMLDKDDIFTRDNKTAHMTASAWVVNKEHTKVLMCYHKIYDSWSWLGGHADGEEDLLKTAVREVREESGIKNVIPLSEKIYSLEVLTVDGHVMKGKYVSSHLHLNLTYLLEAEESEPLTGNEEENKGVRWFPPEQAVEASTEPWFRERIYSKLNLKFERRYGWR